MIISTYIAWQIILLAKDVSLCKDEEITEMYGMISTSNPCVCEKNFCSWFIKPENNTVTTIVNVLNSGYKVSVSYGLTDTELNSGTGIVIKKKTEYEKIRVTALSVGKLHQKSLRLLFLVRPATVCEKFDLACRDGRGCYDIKNVCNNSFECDDHSDESYCGYCEKDEVPCDHTSDHCFSPIQQRCDQILNCPQGEDELNCSSECKNKLQCLNGADCYLQQHICDGRSFCSDHSDENNCAQFCKSKSSSTFILCDDKCINKQSSGARICIENNSKLGKSIFGFSLITIIFLTTCFVVLLCRSYICRRNITNLIRDSPQFPVPSFEDPRERISTELSDSDFLHGGEVYEAFVRSRHSPINER